MAQLDALGVSGIRSFGTEKIEMIKFFPLTLILGQNGAGKTTLIECLRYATSGEAPPGTNGGKTWIHDPQLQDYGGTVRGQVKLRIRTPVGPGEEDKYYTFTRSIELMTKTDRNGKVSQSFRTLDSTILLEKKEDGKRVKVDNGQLSSRCAEIDKEVLSLMDVSKAVLTNVVFCHQEDNCWPLSEGKVLKEKFDQIFGSAGFVKALQKIKVYRNKQSQELKTQKAVKEKFAAIRENQMEKQKQLKGINKDLETQKIKKNQLEDKLKPLKEELDRLAKQESSMSEVQNKISKIKGQMQEKNKSMESLKRNIKEELQGLSLDEIREKKEALTFQGDSTDTRRKIRKNSEEIEQLKNEIRSLGNKKQALSLKLGKAQVLEEQNKKQAHDRKRLVSKTAKELGLETEDIQVIVDFLQKEMKSITSQIEADEQGSEEEQELQSELDSLRTERIKANQSIKMKQETQTKREAEMKQVLDQVSKVENSATKVKSESQLLLKSVQDLKEKILRDSVQDRVSTLQGSIYELEDEVVSLKKVYSGLMRDCVSSINDIREEVKRLDVEITEKSQELETLKKNRMDTQSTRRKRASELQRKLSIFEEQEKQSIGSQSSQNNPEDIEQDIKKTEEQIQAFEEKRSLLLDERNSLEQQQSSQEVKIRNLNDNEQLIILKEELADLSAKLMEEESKVTVKDSQALFNKRSDFQKKYQNILTEIGMTEGTMKSLMIQKKALEDDLNSGKYRTVQSDLKQAIIDLSVTEVLCDDLNKYYKVLDKAVSTYHVRKMEQVNVLIGHYWNLTYQGTDIQSIKIVCDDSVESTADKRKIYNYRVVMVKGDVDMDMRGRCSAGQKVLASIVIRIALSQIFSADCPILTLDEPTTNLDKNNIEALSQAISAIIEDQKGKIQLIVITHDQEFLKYLQNELSQYYYEVERQEDSSSSDRRGRDTVKKYVSKIVKKNRYTGE